MLYSFDQMRFSQVPPSTGFICVTFSAERIAQIINISAHHFVQAIRTQPRSQPPDLITACKVTNQRA